MGIPIASHRSIRMFATIALPPPLRGFVLAQGRRGDHLFWSLSGRDMDSLLGRHLQSLAEGTDTAVRAAEPPEARTCLAFPKHTGSTEHLCLHLATKARRPSLPAPTRLVSRSLGDRVR